MITTTKNQTKTNPQIRLVRSPELDTVIGNMRFYFPIMDDNEIIKMLISKGNLSVTEEIRNHQKPAGLMTQVLNARKNNKLFITGLSEEEKFKLINEL